MLNLSILNIIVFLYIYMFIYFTALVAFFALLISNFSNFSTFYEFKLVYSFAFKFIILTVFLSMAGVPPLGGFFTKLALLTLILNSYSIYLFIFFTALLLFALYFYLQNVRFLILPYNSSNSLVLSTQIKNPYLLVLILFLLLATFFIFNDYIVIFSWLFTF